MPIIRPLISLAFALSALSSTQALSTWYTVPGSSSPAGSTAGDKVRGVNLGGWFVLENWMQPSLFSVPPLDEYTVPDEWTYTSLLPRNESIPRLRSHWASWIVEDDFKRMADYGLNTVRIPVGYWMWNKTDEEPYVGFGDTDGDGTAPQLSYLEQALYWSDMYGMDVIMDMHGAVGSQSGQDNSGRKGDVEFGWNATTIDRTLDALGQMVAFASQDKFNGVVKAYELLNEPYIQAYNSGGMTWETLASYLVSGYSVVRSNEHIVSGSNESMVIVHDCFQPLSNWDYFFSAYAGNWTNYGIDTHLYQAFNDYPNMSDTEQLQSTCGQQSSLTTSQAKLPTIVGEFSIGTQTFCVDYKSCVGLTMEDMVSNMTRSDAFQREFWEVQKDVYELAAGWIFWNWKTDLAPTWSYENAVAQKWIPVDPTEVLYPFTAGATDCLDVSSPIDGDQNIPAYATTAVPIANGTSTPRQILAVTSGSTSTSSVNATASLTSIAGGSKATAGSTSNSSERLNIGWMTYHLMGAVGIVISMALLA